LIFVDVEFHPEDRRPAVLRITGWVFDGDVAITETLAAWVETLEDAAFGAPMNFVGETNEELLVHHGVECDELLRRLFQCVNALADEADADIAVFETFDHGERVGDIAGETARVVDQNAVEWFGFLCCCREEPVERVAAHGSGAGHCGIAEHPFLGDHPSFTGRKTPAFADLVFDAAVALEVAAVAGIDGTSHKWFPKSIMLRLRSERRESS